MVLELKLLWIRMKQQKNLKGKNSEAFKRIKNYITNSSLVLFEREEVFQEVLDTMLQAQTEGKDIDLFLGHDHKAEIFSKLKLAYFRQDIL